MTLIELQEKLGQQIDDLTDPRVPFESKKKLADIATVVSSLAKQMINNADVVLRAEKIFSERKLGDSNIMEMVNGCYALMKKNPDGTIEGKTLK